MSTNSNSKKGIIIGVILLIAIIGWRGYKLYSSFSEDSRYTGNTPEHYFGITTLNTNLVSDFPSNMYRNNLKYPVSGNIIVEDDGKTTRAPKNYVEYIEKYQIRTVEDQIKKLKELKSTPETQEMITLSLDYFTAILQTYKTDLLPFAKKLDEKISQEEAEKLVAQMEEKNMPILNAKKEKLYAVALPYAQKNGLQVNVQNFGK